jgi:hypothetical protein
MFTHFQTNEWFSSMGLWSSTFYLVLFLLRALLSSVDLLLFQMFTYNVNLNITIIFKIHNSYNIKNSWSTESFWVHLTPWLYNLQRILAHCTTISLLASLSHNFDYICHNLSPSGAEVKNGGTVSLVPCVFMARYLMNNFTIQPITKI